MSNAPKRKIGPFELGGRLGIGGMGIVYAATYVKNGKEVAVKVLSPTLSAEPKLLARFTREMAILERLRHDHIVRYFGGGKSGGQHFYAMELMTGGALDEVLKKQRRLSWERTIDIGVQVCDALEHAHNHGIIHRDLKPANLFIGEGGIIKLGDFGIARDLQATALTAPGRTVGSYSYMAPEQIRGNPPVSAQTDLYALGCVLYECVTGQPPFEAQTFPEMLTKHLQEEPPRVTTFAADCPIWLENVIMRLLEKEPEDRYYDALAAQVALREVGQKVAEQQSVVKQTVAGGGTTVASVNKTEVDKLLGKKRRKKRKAVPIFEQVWFLAMCLVVLLSGVVWAVWPLGERELFERADVLMQSSDISDWIKARDAYLEPLLVKYPDGEFASRARDHLDRIDMDRVERQVENRAKQNRDPDSEAERLYVEARRLEKFGDRVLAMEKYRALAELFKTQQDARPLVNLARRQMREIESSAGHGEDRFSFVINRMRDAEKLAATGQLAQAHGVWESIVSLYGNHKEFEPHVLYARARLAGRDAEPPEFLTEPPRQPPKTTTAPPDETSE